VHTHPLWLTDPFDRTRLGPICSKPDVESRIRVNLIVFVPLVAVMYDGRSNSKTLRRTNHSRAADGTEQRYRGCPQDSDIIVR
jgi:hypothetical protein